MLAMKVEPSAKSLTWGVDTLRTETPAEFAKLRAARVMWRAGYIEKITFKELSDQLAAGIAFSPVTYALDFNAGFHVARLEELGIPKGVTVWLDVEGSNLDAPSIILKINAWAATINAAGYEAGLYIGAGCPLTDAQLYALPLIKRYWHSVSRVPDPKVRGCCVRQIRPNDVHPTGIDVDVDITEPDYLGDLHTVAAPEGWSLPQAA